MSDGTLESTTLRDLVAGIYAQIARIKKLRRLSEDDPRRKKMQGPTPHSGVYTTSPASRRRVSEAQKRRWAKIREGKEAAIRRDIAVITK
jgi:hypothetical protein